ncbi:protein POLAR-like 1 [Raphanus sativus]|uniref:Protein POLAR-like 1 n=1 Tax=Raphanus sativus TaxID=3726 RepID=A0A6J0MB05_RAPSA|nr:protein POLAR-like 1 [Raphanus sativus]
MDIGSGGVRAGCMRIRCPSPRRAMARLFNSKEKVKGKNKKKASAESHVRDYDSARIRNFSEHGPHGVDQSTDSPTTIDSELKGREFLFNIGVSCYLLHLIATGKEEIHKIVDLRNDLEKLLECQNDEMRRKHLEFVKIRDNIDKLLEFHNDELMRKRQEQCDETSAVYSTTSDVVDGPESSYIDHYYSPQFLETSLIEREGSLKHYVYNEGEEEDYGGEMDQLEAELEAEFELLQIGQDHECNYYSMLKEVSEKSGDSEGMEFRYMCSEPVEEQQGVCPYELERRLHELMETRQEEEINELQAALEDAKKRLHVKEAEASWWKDTAYIVSEHIPKPSRLTSNSQTRLHPPSR